MTGQLPLVAQNWRQGLDSLSWESLKADIQNGIGCDMAFGYPSDRGQGEILADGKLAGWLPEDFAEAKAMGIQIARIANLTPAWQFCSIGDFERGALNGAAIRHFNAGRLSFRHDTTTNYASLNNWPSLGLAVRGVEPVWAWVADWPNFPYDQEIADIERTVAIATRGKTKLGGIQYRSDPPLNADLTVAIDPNWRP